MGQEEIDRVPEPVRRSKSHGSLPSRTALFTEGCRDSHWERGQ